MPNPLKAAARGLRKFYYSTFGAFGGGSGGATGFRFVLPDDIDTRAVRRRPFENSVVSVCVNFLAAAVSDLDIYVHREKGKGKNKAIEGHPLVKLLDRPNPYHTYSDLWHDTIREWTSGNAYWVKVRSRSGAVVQVIPVVSESMVPISYDPTELITHYRYTAAGVIEELPRSEVVHFRRGSEPANPQHGLSPYHALGRELFTDNALAGMKASLSHNLGMPGLLISTVDPNAVIHEDDIEEIRKRARERTTGRDRGKPWVMRGAWKVDKLSWNLREMDASNWSQEPAERLCAALGLNAMAVNLPTKDRTYANFEEANQSAWRKGVLPLLDFLSVTLDTQLLPDLGDPGTQRVCFDTDDVVELREDQKALYDRVVAVYKGEILKRSEAREEIGYDSGPEDDVYFIGAGETPDVPPAGTIDGNPAVQVAAAQAPGGKPPGDGGANGKAPAPADGKPKAGAKQPAAKALDGATDGRRGDATGPGGRPALVAEADLTPAARAALLLLYEGRSPGAASDGSGGGGEDDAHPGAVPDAVKAATDPAPEGDDRRPFPDDAGPITPEAVAAAVRWWHANAPAEYRGLIDAGPDPADAASKAAREFRWDAERQRFRDGSGRPVAVSAARGALESASAATGADMRRIAGQLADGSINLDEWFLQSRSVIKVSHTAAGLVAAGGKANAGPADAGLIGGELKKEYGYLRDVYNEVNSGKQPLTDGFLARMQAWGGGSIGTFERVRQRRDIAAGYDEEQRVIGSGNPCPSCIDYAGMGWQPAGSLPLPGEDCQCHSNCLCSIERRMTGSGVADEPPPEVPATPPPAEIPAPPPGTLAGLAARLAAATSPSDARQVALDWVAAHAAPGDPTPVQAHGMPAAEAMRTVRLGGLTIRFPDLGDRTKSAVADTIRGLARLGDLPPELTRYTREIVLATGRNKDDAHWELQYGMADFRAMATGGSGGKVVVYNGKPVNGGDLIHEMAHNLAEGRWDSTLPPARTDYAAAIRSGEPPVSHYAAKSPAEDFAEAVRVYAENGDKLRERAPNRYRVIERMLKDPFYGG